MNENNSTAEQWTTGTCEANAFNILDNRSV